MGIYGHCDYSDNCIPRGCYSPHQGDMMKVSTVDIRVKEIYWRLQRMGNII